MSNTWFICKIRYEKTMENGMNKKVLEPYLVDALSFTEAEGRITGELTPFISGEMTVEDISRYNVSEVIPSDKEENDTWYKLKIAFITLDEKSGKEKKSYRYVLIQSCSTAMAEADLHEAWKGTLADYRIEKVEETAILDVFPYTLEPETEETR